MMLACSMAVSAQTIDSLIVQMAQHGAQGNMLKAQNEAAIATNHTGLSLADPSVGFNYLWGSPHDVGQRKDISVTQTLDFATLSGSKRKEAIAKDNLANAIYERGTLSLKQEAMLLLVDIAAANDTRRLYAERIAANEKLVEACRKRINAGDASKLELNKATLTLAATRADASDAETERQRLLHSPMVTMNLTETQREMLQSITTEEMEKVIRRMAPATKLTDAEALETQKQVEAAKAALTNAQRENLPEVTAGFMAELTREEKFKGISIGLNIPIWNNARRIRSAKAQVVAAESEHQLKQKEVEARREQYHQLAVSTLNQYEDVKKSISILDAQEKMLQKAYAEGEMSIVDFIIEQEAYYDLHFRCVQAHSRHLAALCLQE